MTSEVHVAKMICKSIDALTREIYMLRKDILEGWKLNDEMRELDKGAAGTRPTHDRETQGGSTGCG